MEGSARIDIVDAENELATSSTSPRADRSLRRTSSVAALRARGRRPSEPPGATHRSGRPPRSPCAGWPAAPAAAGSRPAKGHRCRAPRGERLKNRAKARATGLRELSCCRREHARVTCAPPLAIAVAIRCSTKPRLSDPRLTREAHHLPLAACAPPGSTPPARPPSSASRPSSGGLAPARASRRVSAFVGRSTRCRHDRFWVIAELDRTDLQGLEPPRDQLVGRVGHALRSSAPRWPARATRCWVGRPRSPRSTMGWRRQGRQPRRRCRPRP